MERAIIGNISLIDIFVNFLIQLIISHIIIIVPINVIGIRFIEISSFLYNVPYLFENKNYGEGLRKCKWIFPSNLLPIQIVSVVKTFKLKNYKKILEIRSYINPFSDYKMTNFPGKTCLTLTIIFTLILDLK